MGPNWNKEAETYNRFVFSELEDTRTYLDAIGLEGSESVLDVCCGPGRISVLAAERGCSVVGIDSAEKMLECAAANAQRFGVDDRCSFQLVDWDCALPGQNVQQADVVIASRCRAMMDVEKLSALAKRKVAIQIFADAPSLPALKGVLFSGCGNGLRKGGASQQGPDGVRKEGGPVVLTPADCAAGAVPPMGAPGAAGGPGGMGPKGPQGPQGPGGLFPPKGPGSELFRKGCAYIDIMLKAYNAGYNPNVRIMPERFRADFQSVDEAVAWICSLDPERTEGFEDRVRLNAAPFLSETDAGVAFCISTTAAIIWWDVDGLARWGMWPR